MAGITLQNISKSFGATRVLRDVDLDIRDGEFLTLVGPSGCGKSTLLRIIAGLESQSGGHVAIGGRAVDQVRASERDLAMVFQSYALYPHLSVRQNIETPLRLRDLNAWERLPLLGLLSAGRAAKMRRLRAQVAETAEILKIEELMDRKPGQLSGGQRQRVALGRAMVRKPAAFLMDEPLSNLDAALRVHMRSELAELHRSLATTFIYVTHDQSEALTMSDRMAVMMGGDILQLGTPDEIYHDPRDLRVAQFIGTPQMDVFDAVISGGQGVTVNGVPLAAEVSGGGDLAFVAVRPEHLTLLPVGGAGAGQPLTVTLKENLGADFFIHGHIGDGAAPVIVRATPAEAADVAIGSVCALAPLNAAEVMAFERDHARLDLVMTGAPAAVLERV